MFVKYTVTTALFLAGCSNPSPKAYYTSEVCGNLTGMEGWGSDAESFSPPDIPNMDCVEAILGDFNADVGSLEVASGVYADALLYPTEDAWNTPLGFVVGGGFLLLRNKWSDVDHHELNNTLDRINNKSGRGGIHPTGWLLYDWVTSKFKRTYTSPKEQDLIRYRTGGSFSVGYGEPSPIAVSVMVHQAMHADGAPRHIQCANTPVDSCDEDHSGSYGAQISVLNSGIFQADIRSSMVMHDKVMLLEEFINNP